MHSMNFHGTPRPFLQLSRKALAFWDRQAGLLARGSDMQLTFPAKDQWFTELHLPLTVAGAAAD